MKCALIFTLLMAIVYAAPTPLGLSDIFPGFLGNAKLAAPAEPQEVVKRQVFGNPDAELKQISLNSLIGSLENSLFESAISVNGASAPGTEVAEIRPEIDAEHGITKRSDGADEQTTEHKLLVQTTKKVPLSDDGQPAHLIIDRVSVQPHTGSVSLIPTFQVHHTKVVSSTIKEDTDNDGNADGKQTKISITKTSITSTAPIEAPEAQSSNAAVVLAETSTSTSSTTPESTSTSTTAAPKLESSSSTTSTAAESSSSSSTTTTSTTSTTSTTTTSSTTTEQPILQLKKVEEQLKEKVAEVEAEPIILSSRV